MSLTAPRKAMLALGVIPVAALTITGAVATALLARGSTPYHYTATAPARTGGVVLHAENAALTFAASADGAVHVTGTGSYTRHTPTLSTREIGDQVVVTVAGCNNPWFGHCSLALTVLLPPASPLDARTSNGDVETNGLTGPAQITTTNGAIEVGGDNGTLTLTTTNGAITALGLHAAHVLVHSTNGALQLAFAAPPTLVDATTTNGGIDVQIPAASVRYAITTHTTNGQTDTSSVANQPGAPRTIAARTTNGDITLRPAP